MFHFQLSKEQHVLAARLLHSANSGLPEAAKIAANRRKEIACVALGPSSTISLHDGMLMMTLTRDGQTFVTCLTCFVDVSTWTYICKSKGFVPYGEMLHSLTTNDLRARISLRCRRGLYPQNHGWVEIVQRSIPPPGGCVSCVWNTWLRWWHWRHPVAYGSTVLAVCEGSLFAFFGFLVEEIVAYFGSHFDSNETKIYFIYYAILFSKCCAQNLSFFL